MCLSDIEKKNKKKFQILLSFFDMNFLISNVIYYYYILILGKREEEEKEERRKKN